MPITFDEYSAALNYPNFTVWQIMMYPNPWPSNHILNTLCIKLEEYLWGVSPLGVRVHSILAFVLMYWGVYLMAIHFFSKKRVLFCLPFFILFCNPFLLDFFGLARGYGLSNALMLFSVYCLLRFSTSYKPRWYYLTILFSMLASYANFTLLIYWVAVHLVLVSLQIIYTHKTGEEVRKKIPQVLITAAIAAAFLALCFNPLYKMQSTNQFIYWSKVGFFKDTVVDQATQFLYGPEEPWAIFSAVHLGIYAVTIFIIGCLWSVYRLGINIRSAVSEPLVVLSLLLLATWLVNVGQTVLLGSPFLTTRTALSYYVLFALVFVFLLRDISLRIDLFAKTVVPLIMVLFTVHLFSTANLKSVREWWFDAHTYEVQNYLNDYRLQHTELKLIYLNTTWIFYPSFCFYCDTKKTRWLYVIDPHHYVDTTSQTLFYYATEDDARYLKNYKPVLYFKDAGNVLLMKK